MGNKLLLTSVFIALVAGVCVLAWLQPDQTDSPSASATQPSPAQSTTDDATVDSTRARPVEFEASLDTEDRDLLEATGDADCTASIQYDPNDGATVTEANSCNPETPSAVHPYEYYDDQTLRELSYADAMAAEILGIRLSDSSSQESLDLFVRAAALRGGDPETLLKYAGEVSPPAQLDGEFVLAAVRTKYVLSKAADILGHQSANLAQRTADVVEAFPNSGDVIERFNLEADSIVQTMRDIQIEVTGSSTILQLERF